MEMRIVEEAINKETGLYKDNPTHLEIRQMAESQQEIVDMLKGIYDFGHEEYHYMDENDTRQKPMSGILKFREMDEERTLKFFRTLFRYRSNIISIHMKLGEYPNVRKVSTNKTAALNTNKKRFHVDNTVNQSKPETAELIADIFNDSSRHIVEMKYTVSKDPKNFFVRCEFFETAKEEDYLNDKFFKPALGLEFYSVN